MCFPKSSCSIAFNLSKNITVCDTLYAKFELFRLIGVKRQNESARETETTATRDRFSTRERISKASMKCGQIARGLSRKNITWQTTTHSFNCRISRWFPLLPRFIRKVNTIYVWNKIEQELHQREFIWGPQCVRSMKSLVWYYLERWIN
jgi:hypothetical protein